MKVDFHMHSLHSDGVLSCRELLSLACSRNLDQIAITDHDTLAGYREFGSQFPTDLRLITGCEFSASWQSLGVHIVGLNLDLCSPVMAEAMAVQAKTREQRSLAIAKALAKKGFADALDSAKKHARGAVIGRPHFAEFLVEQGYVKDRKQAFKKYLGAGKIGDVKANWRDLGQVCQWITDAGGVAVLAHPLKYGLTQTKLRQLLADFEACGGRAIEVISGDQNPDKTAQLAKLAHQFDLYASVGSDFHQPGQRWADLGMIPALPSVCKPVWTLWS